MVVGQAGVHWQPRHPGKNTWQSEPGPVFTKQLTNFLGSFYGQGALPLQVYLAIL